MSLSSGSSSESALEACTFVELLRWRAVHQPGQRAYTFLVDGNTEEVCLTYGELDQQARSIAALLQSLDTAGERALLLYPPGLEFFTAFFGCLNAGVVAVPSYPPRRNRPTPHLQAIVANAQPQVVLTTSEKLLNTERWFKHAPYLESLQWLATDNVAKELANRWQDPAPRSDMLALLQYTSGSTAAPRGVMLSHANLLHNTGAISRRFELTPDSRALGWLPPYHDSGLVGGILLALYGGFPLTFMSPVAFLQKPFRWLRAMSRYKATISGGPNFAYDLCVRKITPAERKTLDLSSWEVALNGAEPVRHETLEQFAAAFESSGFRREAFYPAYGLEEATLLVSGGLKSALPIVYTVQRAALEQNLVAEVPGEGESTQTLVGCGQTLSDQKLVIVHPDSLTQCPPDHVGEIWVSGPSVAQGYWNRPEETEHTFRAHLMDTMEGPFLRTGDLGFLRDGELFITGRLKDMIIIRGRNFYPQDIELTLERRHPALRPGCGAAFSVDTSGEERLVVVQEVERRYRTTDLGEAIWAIRQAVAEEHEVQVWAVSLIKPASIPKTPSGKIQRHLCRARYLSGSLDVVEEWKMTPEPETAMPGLSINNLTRKELLTVHPEQRQQLLESLIRARVARMLGLDDPFRIDPQHPLTSLGLDSLMAIELQNNIETSLGVALPIASLLQSSSIAQLAAKALTHLSAPFSAPSVSLSASIVSSPQRYLSFPLNDIQQAYWVGRTGDFELGNVSAYVYAEFEGTELDLGRLNYAWQRLIERHDMLRVIVESDGQQRILERVPPYQIELDDLRGQKPQRIADRLESVRKRMSHQVLRADQWPLFEIRAHQLDNQRIRLHIGIDLLIADARSFLLLIKEWAQLYQNPEAALVPLELSFRDYVAAEAILQDSDPYRQAQEYWKTRLLTLPPGPELPTARLPDAQRHPGFTRRNAELDAESWQRLKSRAVQAGLTPSVALCAAYAEVLATWSKSPRFTVNLTLFNRQPLHPQVHEIIGDFTSTILLEVDTPAQESFESRARRLQQQLAEDLDHRHYSGVRVLRDLARADRGSIGAAMPVVFTCLINEDLGALDWLGEMIYGISQTPQVLLDHQTIERNGALVINWDAVEALFPEGLLEDMFGAYCRLLKRLADEESAWRKMALQLVPLDQLEQRADVNATEAPLSDHLLHTLFAVQVPKRQHQPAVISSTRELTYLELHRRANDVGRRLRAVGAQQNKLVAVVMEKGWEQVVAAMGVLLSGAAYLPISAGLPKERIWHLLEHGEVEFVLTQSWLDMRLEWPESVQRLCVDVGGQAGEEDHPLDSLQTTDDLAYVIYTSGSTGMPKGVMIDHRGAVNTILDINHRFGIGSADRVLSISSLDFDLSVYDIFGTLAAGGTIVVPDATATRDPAHWAALIRQESVTVWNSVPALMQLLVEYVAGKSELLGESLRLVLLSGDWIPVSLPNAIKSLVEGVQVISLGGATEGSIWSILYPIETVNPTWTSIPYGRAMVNQGWHVLNEALEPCPVWVPGQLYIGGVGVAKGYWRDEEKTRASFFCHPETGERLYRTGDLGRYLPDGNIELLGREDFQVKIQGYRIELGEIEFNLAQHPSVQTAVAATTGELHGKKRLAAYVVPVEGRSPTVSALRSFLTARLPEYMVPSLYVLLDELPLTANGKVDRKALPDPVQAAGRPTESPRAEETTIAAQVSQLVAGVLQVDSIDPNADLADLGADSLDIIRISNMLESNFGFRPKMDKLLSLSTVNRLSRYFEQHLLDRMVSLDKVELATDRSMNTLLASFEVTLDPQERDGFRRQQPGLRRDAHERPYIQLVIPGLDDALRREYTTRQSHRRFSSNPIPLDDFAKFLGCLRQISINEEPKYLYGSAGGLYPVQTYLHIRPNRMEGVAAGVYYYHPREHQLLLLSAGAQVDRNVHWPANRPIFDEAAFSIFLIAQLSAIAPLYGEESLHFATIEAGLMSQLLETIAPVHCIGLCQIGSLDFARIRHLFALGEDHVLVHSLLGGLVDDARDTERSGFRDATVAGVARGLTVDREGDRAAWPASQWKIGTRSPWEDAFVEINVADLNSDAVLDPTIHPSSPVQKPATEPSCILLTGATGFLGTHLLHELLQQTDAIVYCLVRCHNVQDGKERLQRNLESYTLCAEGLGRRVVVIPGDLSRSHLDLAEEHFQSLASRIDVIYHSGAWVNGALPYQELRATNVLGTQEVLRLASQTKLKPVHYMSSLAVFPFDGRAFLEQDTIDHNRDLFGGYAQSKWVAEKLVTVARSRGIPISIYRPGTVTGHSQTGAFNANSYLENMIKGCIQLGKGPDLKTIVDMVPVDYASRAIVHLSRRPESVGKVFHLTNTCPMHMSELLEWIRVYGYSIHRVSYDAWKRELFYAEAFRENALYLFRVFLAELEERQMIVPRHDCQNTVIGLAGTSIACPPVDNELLNTYFSCYVRSGFLCVP